MTDKGVGISEYRPMLGNIIHVRFGVLMAVTMKKTLLWYVMPCVLVDGCKYE
jgi:hypothetical protein